ncbi:MAG: DUF4159 domain-containing protein [Rhodospirillaceae bacterium]|nr:DUF4159 domain-containing protein [Rhodospirillaceae bacterium]
MISLGALSFASPAMLLAALALPAIWLLLRMTPPAVTRVAFPAVRLMFGLAPTARTPARTPWWLVALRIFIAGLVIAALAEPVLNAQRLNQTGPVVVVLDDGWAAAKRWPERVAAARGIVEGADLRRRPVLLVTTAATSKNTEPHSFNLTDARDALGRLAQLEPRPWPSDLGPIIAGIEKAVSERAEVFWISDGVNTPRTQDLVQTLQRLGSLNIIAAPRGDAPLMIAQPQRNASEGGTAKIEMRVKRVAPENARPAFAASVRAMDATGAVLAETTAAFKDGADAAPATFVVPSELANRIARFDIAGQASAAATALSDDRWQQRPVGLFAAAVAGTTAPLLEDGFYLTQALNERAEVRVGETRELLARPLSMLIVSGGQRLTEDEAKAVQGWVEGGGMLIRFAGPRLDPTGDKLLPVKLRSAGRNLGGALSWGEPAGLGPFPDKSPFKGLSIPGDVKVSTQILAEPSPDLPDKTWARLSDGTPLITAERRGGGWVVLFHVTSTPEWSNLPLSGLFVGMMQTLLDLSQGVTADNVETPPLLPPITLLDGLGRAVPPGPTSAAIESGKLAVTQAGVDAPPGLYGTPRAKTALNLGPALWSASAIDGWPASTNVTILDGLKAERGLKPWVLLTALILLLADFVLSFALRGLLPRVSLRPQTATAALVLCALLMNAATAIAGEPKPDNPLNPAMAEAILQTRLAYVATGSADLDRISEAGLTALTRVLAARTSAEMAAPAALSLNSEAATPDLLMAYPLIYWRVTPDQALPSSASIAAVNQYFRHGGMIVFDAPDQVGAIGGGNGSAGGRLRDILSRLDMPPVMPLNADHVLTRSFYLVQGLPGRYAGGAVYVERGSSANDGVSSVVIGAHDWAAAWARDAAGLPLYPVVPGGEQQREYAYRSGVNMVMYALTGNYKADQVHLPAIMQRLTQ